MRRGKREARITVNAPPMLKKAIEIAAARDDRKVSHWFVRLAERDPSVQIALQQISGASERRTQ
jgi:translation elongation factor EF-G